MTEVLPNPQPVLRRNPVDPSRKLSFREKLIILPRAPNLKRSLNINPEVPGNPCLLPPRMLVIQQYFRKLLPSLSLNIYLIIIHKY